MDDAKIGRSLRVLRRRLRLRQVDVARAAGVSQGAISLIERGHVSTLSLRTLRRAFAAVDAGFDCSVIWRAGALDRVLDERHSQLVGALAARLKRLDWACALEVTFSEFGERGSIDVLALRPPVALVVEVKTELASVEEMLRGLDAKRRLAARIVAARDGWQPRVVSTLLVMQDGTTARRRVSAHESVLSTAFPTRGGAAAMWLRNPVGAINGLVFMSPTNPRSGGGAAAASSRNVPSD